MEKDKDVSFGLPNFEYARLKASDWAERTGNEYGLLLSPKGEVVAEREGEKHQVSFAGLEEVVEGKWIIHSHPNNSSLSEQDIILTGSYDTAGIVAVGLDGSVFSTSTVVTTNRSWVTLQLVSRATTMLARALLNHGLSPYDTDIAASIWMGMELKKLEVMDYRYKLGSVAQAAWTKAVAAIPEIGE